MKQPEQLSLADARTLLLCHAFAFGEAYVEGIRALHAGSPLMDPLGAMGKEGRS